MTVPMNPAVSWVAESLDYEPLLQTASAQPAAPVAPAQQAKLQRLQARFW